MTVPGKMHQLRTFNSKYSMLNAQCSMLNGTQQWYATSPGMPGLSIQGLGLTV